MSLRKPVRRVLVVGVGLVVLLLAACATPVAGTVENHTQVNQVRGANGLGGLPRSLELDIKAQAQAQRMADANTIFHSASLTDGVSAGWMQIGENVAMAGSVGAAQAALEASPPHRENLLNPYYTELGIGVVQKGSYVFLVQVFVQR